MFMMLHSYAILIIFSTPEILSFMSLFFNSTFQILCMDGLLACLSGQHSVFSKLKKKFGGLRAFIISQNA